MCQNQAAWLNAKTQDPGPCQACLIVCKASAKFCPICGRNLTLKEPQAATTAPAAAGNPVSVTMMRQLNVLIAQAGYGSSIQT